MPKKKPKVTGIMRLREPLVTEINRICVVSELEVPFQTTISLSPINMTMLVRVQNIGEQMEHYGRLSHLFYNFPDRWSYYGWKFGRCIVWLKQRLQT